MPGESFLVLKSLATILISLSLKIRENDHQPMGTTVRLGVKSGERKEQKRQKKEDNWVYAGKPKT